MFAVKNLTSGVETFDNLADAEKYFENHLNSTVIVEQGLNNEEVVVKSRTHKEIGIIEINNKCVYLKVPFYQPSDKPEIRISKIGETPDKLRSKMDIIDETWF